MKSHRLRWFPVLAAVLCAGPHDATSHVSPAVKKNNRYIKLTVFPDSVRLAYIIYIGEIPGASARARMDLDRDGTLTEKETETFSKGWADRIARAVTFDGAIEARLVWDSVDMGLGDPSAAGGAFSLDLVSWVCVDPQFRHVTLRDLLVVPEPGETEVVPEESPGTELVEVSIGGRKEPTLRWTGSSSPLETGLEISWTADDNSISKRCQERRRKPWRRQRAIFAIAALLGLALFAAFALRRWRNQRG